LRIAAVTAYEAYFMRRRTDPFAMYKKHQTIPLQTERNHLTEMSVDIYLLKMDASDISEEYPVAFLRLLPS